METRILSYSSIRRKARRDVERRLQEILDSNNDNYIGPGSSVSSCVLSDEYGQQRTDELFMDTHIYGGTEEEQAAVEKESVEVVFEEDAANSDAVPIELGDSADISEEESDSDLEPEEPCTLSDSLHNWALTFGVSLIALTALLGILRFYHPDLPKDARTLLKTKNNLSIQKRCGGMYYYFGILSSIKNMLSQAFETIVDGFILKLQINIDGLPLFKSSGVQLWPILGLLLSVPIKEPVVIGLFCGSSKPNSAEEYLRDFVEELKDLERGFDFNGKRLFLKLDSVICDAPARAFVKNIKSHNGYNGCDKCVQQGQYINRRMTFPLTNCTLRTDLSFAQRCDEEHHHGPNAFDGSSVGMVSQFPLDYMHLVCLGVVRKLLILWLRGSLKFRLPANTVSRISDYLQDWRKYIPVEFARKPRSLRDIDRWKATEFRMFLLYIGPVILPSFLEENLYHNFMLLFSAISILVSPKLSLLYWQYAHTLLQAFVCHFGDIYGKDALVYNVHSLVHLAHDVKQYGSLDRISAFPYENHLQKLKKLVRKPERPLAQIVCRLSEQITLKYDDVSNTLKKSHFVGPVPPELAIKGVKGQYREMHTVQWTIKCSTGNNIFVIGEQICMIDNVVQCYDGLYVVYRAFSEKSLFFTYPFSSDFLNIYKVSGLSEQAIFGQIVGITHKCIALPYEDSFIAMPVLHTL